MRSYVSATLVKTPATRSRFSASVTVSKPKCVGLEGSGRAYSGIELQDLRVEEKDRNNLRFSAEPDPRSTAGMTLCRAGLAAAVIVKLN